MARTLKVEIDLENDAFQPDAAEEAARILTETADLLRTRQDRGLEVLAERGVTLFDVNGNGVGGVFVTQT